MYLAFLCLSYADDDDFSIFVSEDNALHVGVNGSSTRFLIGNVDVLDTISNLQAQMDDITNKSIVIERENGALQTRLNRLEAQLASVFAGRRAWGLSGHDYILTNNVPGSLYGISAALDRDILVVGSIFDQVDGVSAGAVYVYRMNNGSLVYELQYKLAANVPEDASLFGYAVAVDGDILVVGAYFENNGGVKRGMAYVFARNATGVFVQEYKLHPSDPADNDYFGSAVALAGDVLVVGAIADDDNNISNSGSVYVFQKHATSGIFEEQYKLMANDGAAFDRFGIALAMENDILVVGAYCSDVALRAGCVYLFTRDASTGIFTQTHKLFASDAQAYDRFGISVAIDNDILIIGAAADDSSVEDTGSIYVFEKSKQTGEFSEKYKLTADDGKQVIYFGIATAVRGNTLVVGRTGEAAAVNTTSSLGAVFVFSC